LRSELKEHQETISGLSISSDSKYLVSVSWDQTLRLWETSTGTLLKKIKAHSSGVLAVTFLTGQKTLALATGSFDQTIKLWQIRENTEKEIDMEEQDTLRDHRGSIQSLAFNSHQQILLSGSYDQTVKQWKINDFSVSLPAVQGSVGRLITTGYDPSGAIYAVAIDPLGQYFVSSGGDGKVIVWALGREEQLSVLVGNIFSVQSLAISSDGRIVAAGCINGQIVLWQIEENIPSEIKPWRILKRHTGPIKGLAFRAISNILFSGGSDGAIYLWQPDKAEPLTQLQGDNEDNTPISAILLSPDGSYLVTGDNLGKIKIWSRE